MRKFLIVCLMLVATVALQAAPLKGLSVNSVKGPIVVCIDGQEMCPPTLSCFVANLRSGYYRIEVFEIDPNSSPRFPRRGAVLYNNRIYISNSGVKEIVVGDRDVISTDRDREDGRDVIYTDRDRDYRYDGGSYRRVRPMSANMFETLYTKVRNEPFDSDKLNLIQTAVIGGAYFTCDQCKRLMSIYSFDKDKIKVFKLLYPRIVDRENMFLVMDALTFSSSKNEISQFMRDFDKKR